MKTVSSFAIIGSLKLKAAHALKTEFQQLE